MLTKTDDELMDVRRWNALPIDPSEKGQIRLLNAGLIERGDTLVAHGWLDLESMNLVRVDDYQREVLRGKMTGGKSIHQAVLDGAVLPDIVLGMRGQRVTFPKGTNICTLLDPVYVIDGLQRIFACKTAAEINPDIAPQLRLGAEVRFDTTKESERELFNILNTRRTPVAPNVILRNLRNDHPSILTLYGLCHTDKNFPLYERVCWNQRMSRQELITAMTLTRGISTLMGRSGRLAGSRADELSRRLDEYSRKMSLNLFRRNVVEFFDIIDACWGIRTIQYNEKAAQLRTNFLMTLGKIFCMHENFWKGNQLILDAAQKRRLASFPVLDPEIARLCGSGGQAVELLFAMLLEHLNKGMKKNHLVRRQDSE